MAANQEVELLVRTDPGTPCGELMRRYWQPAALAEELPEGGAPLAVRLLGEDLVLFRDNQGRPGLLALHCSHRGADLSYGRIEDGGLRCIYHGWLYDIKGRCLDQPGEPGGGVHRDSIRHPAYPCVEKAGIIFAYLGPGEAPLFPKYEFLNVPDEQVYATKLLHECNYLQANEGNIDLSHLSFLHYNYMNKGIGGGAKRSAPETPSEPISGRGAVPTVETADAELTGFGVRSYKIRRDVAPDQYQLYLTEFVLPNFTAFPGILRGVGGYMVNWHVPIDDTHHWKYTFIFNRERQVERDWRERASGLRTPDYRPVRNKRNRYLQDRKSMQRESYSGIGFDFVAQDLWVTEGQGPIRDRSSEHLVSMDKAVLAARKLLLTAVYNLMEGREPPNVVRDPSQNGFRIVAFNGVLSNAKNWREHGKDLEAEVKA